MPKKVPIETKSRKSVSVITTVKPNWRALEEEREDLFAGGDSIVSSGIELLPLPLVVSCAGVLLGCIILDVVGHISYVSIVI